MAIMLPGELDFVLDILGFEWPNINEDAVRDAANLVRALKEDLEATLDDLDDKIDGDLSEAFTSKAATAFIEAWTENRTQNMDQLIDALPSVAEGIDAFATAIEAMKTKVIAELAITAAQIAAAAATSVVTLGIGGAVSAGLIAARKLAVDAVVDIAVGEMIGAVAAQVIEPLASTIIDLSEAAYEAQLTTSGSEQTEFDMSYDLMEQLAQALDDCGADQEEICSNFATQVASLPLFAA